MKKFLMSMLILGILAGCGSQSTTDQKSDKLPLHKVEKKKPDKNSESPKSKYPFPNSTSVGNAKLTVSTPAGDSSNGNAPVLFVKPDEILIQIGADLENFQGDKQTFIYVDKIFKSTEQAGESTQTNVDLEKNDLKQGLHTVSAVQFDNDDPSTGKVINFVEAKYEVKDSK